MKKRLFPLLLCAVLLCGCSRGVPMLNPVDFYYLRAEYVYGVPDGVVAVEAHESSGHMGDLEYLLELYFLGPMDETMVNPFPEGTSLVHAENSEDGLHVELTDSARELTDPHFSLACTCLSMTCMDILPVDAVTVTSGSRSVTTSRDGILTTDDYMQQSNVAILSESQHKIEPILGATE